MIINLAGGQLMYHKDMLNLNKEQMTKDIMQPSEQFGKSLETFADIVCLTLHYLV